MPPNTKPTIILVHGAWHVPSHYTSFIQHLQRANFSVYCPLLPSCDSAHHPTADLYADAQVIRNQILSLLSEPRSIILLLHSSGGVVGSEAVKGLSANERKSQGLEGGVIHLIYMCAFMLQIGESVSSASVPRPVPDPVEFDEATNTTSICVDPIHLFYADVEDERGREMAKLLVPRNAKAMADVVTFEAWSDVPVTYLRTEEDRVFSPEWQDRQIQAVREKGVRVGVESLRSSHSPFLSVPGEVIAGVERVAEQCDA